MLSLKNVAYAALILAGSGTTQTSIGQEPEDRLFERLAASLPKGWNVTLTSSNGHACLDIVTPKIPTKGAYGGASPFPQTISLTFQIDILPRYSSAMLAKIKAHNAPLRERLNSLGKGSREAAAIQRQLIDEPMFMDSRCGYSLGYFSRLPVEQRDLGVLIAALSAASIEWKAVDSDEAPIDIMKRILMPR